MDPGTSCWPLLMPQLATLIGHTLRVLYLAISPDGQVNSSSLIFFFPFLFWRGSNLYCWFLLNNFPFISDNCDGCWWWNTEILECLSFAKISGMGYIQTLWYRVKSAATRFLMNLLFFTSSPWNWFHLDGLMMICSQILGLYLNVFLITISQSLILDSSIWAPVTCLVLDLKSESFFHETLMITEQRKWYWVDISWKNADSITCEFPN